MVSYLFPAPTSAARVAVRDGVVTLSGRIRDTSLIPVAARLIRAVEGVVDVEFDLSEHARSSESTAASSAHGENASPS